jgi:site-specific DNA-cytosine methylase
MTIELHHITTSNYVFWFTPFAGMVVLKMLGIRVKKYYASEVDKDAINVSRLNHGGTIEYIGAVQTLGTEKLSALGPVDLLLGGSPCADLSLVNPDCKGLYGKYIML